MKQLLSKFQQPLFLTGIAGGVKLILKSFGFAIPDATVDATINGAAAVAMIIGIIVDHNKQPSTPVQQTPQQPQPPAQP